MVTILLYRLEKNINREKEVPQTYDESILYNIKDPGFWIDKIEDKDLLLMNSMEIEQFNSQIFSQHDFLIDLEDHVDNITGEELRELIKNISKIPKEIRYDREGNIMDEDYFNKFIHNLNLESFPTSIPIRYGVTTKRTVIRTFPTLEPSYKEKDDTHFDRFMETAIYLWEPLIIYSESADGEWYFGRMYNYLGWIPKKDVAIGDKEEIFYYINLEPFLTVIDKQIYLDGNLLDMGVRIPIIDEEGDSYIVALPIRNQEGQLEIAEKEIHILDKFNKGYLPYTKENIIRQGFKFYGEEYGWGGKDNKRDCSAFIMDIHRTFGLKLPRNSIEHGMETIGKIYSKENIPPASILYMPGHTMLYLGEYEGLGYILHQFAGYYERGEEGHNYIEVMRTDITPINIKTSNGKTYMEMVSICKEFIMD